MQVLSSTIAPPAGELFRMEVNALGLKWPLKVIQSLEFSFAKWHKCSSSFYLDPAKKKQQLPSDVELESTCV